MRKLLYIFIFLFLSFNFDAVPPPPNGWYQQFLPDLNGESISDIYFVDSLIGFAVTGDGLSYDSNYILKTTNGGDNWTIKLAAYKDFFRVQFINQLTGFVCGGYNAIGQGLMKTTDGGENWITLNAPASIYFDDMSVLNEDTIWLAQGSSLDGGVFRTTNGGVSWTHQLGGGAGTPDKIYMVNRNLGFASEGVITGTRFFRTTNSGLNWITISWNDGFLDMHFVNDSTGWKCNWNMMKTTDRGVNWIEQPLPPEGGIVISNRMVNFTIVNKDTLWGVGGSVFYGPGQFRGLLFKTTNGGNNWSYTVPDTSIHIGGYYHVQFINKNIGWAYLVTGGIHTTTGGMMGIQHVSSEIPVLFKLFQNYPNLFNSQTTIEFGIKKKGNYNLVIYDCLGRKRDEVFNEYLKAGSYSVSFNGDELQSGVYFYRLSADGNVVDTRKMVLVK